MKTLKHTIGPVLLTGCLTLSLSTLGANAESEAAGTTDAVPASNAPASVPAEEFSLGPDDKQLFALGMIESGNRDRSIGGAGEVSRYQIIPAVWKSYSASSEYADPQISVQVARQHWIYLAKYFKEKTGRNPDNFDMYVLWNTKFGYYAGKKFSQQDISHVIQNRAERYVNLVNRKT